MGYAPFTGWGGRCSPCPPEYALVIQTLYKTSNVTDLVNQIFFMCVDGRRTVFNLRGFD